jgi:histidinol-phosphate aminotransferase
MALNISTSTAASRFFEYKVDQKKRSISKIGKIRFDLAEGLRSEEKKYATLPDCQSISLRKDLSIFLNVAVENISIFAGADEIIEMIPRLYLDVDKMALVIVPTFERMIATNYKAGGFVEPFSLKAENNFKISDEDIVEITTRANVIDARIIWVCTPNNPTGQVTSLDKISSIARKNPSRLIVVNEVYQEYFSCDSEKSAVTLVNDTRIFLWSDHSQRRLV